MVLTKYIFQNSLINIGIVMKVDHYSYQKAVWKNIKMQKAGIFLIILMKSQCDLPVL